jgi:hypothetical protein
VRKTVAPEAARAQTLDARVKRHLRSFLAVAKRLAVLAAIAGMLADPASAEDARIAKYRAAEHKTFTDAQIADGFFKIAFGAEFNIAGRIDRIRKYHVPIRVYADNLGRPDRRAQVAIVVADIQSKIEHIDIAMADKKADANVLVTLVRDRDLGRYIRKFYGVERARQIQKSLEPQCLSGFRKDDNYRIQASDVLVAVDAGEFIFYDCIYEELLQSLGPINDDDSVPWTMFNDQVQKGFFDIYDQYLLNILYHPRIRAGMTRDDVRALLPEILLEIRSFITKTNDLK